MTLSYELQKIGRRWGVECHYIPNGADPIENLEVADGPKLEGRFKIVYTGDKARWKRTEDICKAMRSVPKDVKLYLTGRTEEYLKPYASENCVFLGWLSKPEQFAVMSQADAFVCTSDQDCNAKLQEYLRWKKPILAFDGEANNFFKNGENALLAPGGDYAPLILRLADDPALCRRLRARLGASPFVVPGRNVLPGDVRHDGRRRLFARPALARPHLLRSLPQRARHGGAFPRDIPR